MKKTIIIMVLCILAFQVFGESDKESPWTGAITGYKPMYFITGIGEDQVKMNMSLKVDPFYPNKFGIYLGYSQLMFWDLYNLSSPFKHIDFNPELFWRFESGNNFAGDYIIPFIDYVQVGLWEHISNGQPAPADESEPNLSRGYDRIYLQFQASVGSWIRFGLNFKYFYCLFFTMRDEVHDNPDIQDYIGSFVLHPFIQYYNEELDDRLELYADIAAGGGANGLDFNYGFLEIGFKSYKLLSRFRIYAQYYQGFCESISDYNVRTQNAILEDGEETILPFSFRVGVILE